MSISTITYVLDVNGLHEWYIKTKQQLGVKEAKRLQSNLKVTKSVRRYNTPDRLLPGTQFEFKNKVSTMSGQITNGQYLRAVGDTKTNYPTKQCTIIKHNKTS
jgi:hypothetical protein